MYVFLLKFLRFPRSDTQYITGHYIAGWFYILIHISITPLTFLSIQKTSNLVFFDFSYVFFIISA